MRHRVSALISTLGEELRRFPEHVRRVRYLLRLCFGATPSLIPHRHRHRGRWTDIFSCRFIGTITEESRWQRVQVPSLVPESLITAYGGSPSNPQLSWGLLALECQVVARRCTLAPDSTTLQLRL